LLFSAIGNIITSHESRIHGGVKVKTVTLKMLANLLERRRGGDGKKRNGWEVDESWPLKNSTWAHLVLQVTIYLSPHLW